MTRRIFVACAGYAIAGIPGALLMAVVAVWLGSDRLGGTAALIGFPALIVGFITTVWCNEGDVPSRLAPRADRKRLRDEQRRINFDADIRRMEREAGIR